MRRDRAASSPIISTLIVFCMHAKLPKARARLQIWKKASKAAGFKIKPQVLRKWHSTMLGELMVPDRFVDVFQGRAPKNVLAKHYTGKGLEMLKRTYDKTGLKVLC